MTVDLRHLPWDDVVVKPAVGVGGNGVVRHATQDDLDALTLASEGAVDAVVQPYLASVEQAGEVSVVCIDGQPDPRGAQAARGGGVPRPRPPGRRGRARPR